MEFITKTKIPASQFPISHKSNLLLFGSCFIENIGRLLLENKFNANLNPFGILYNPLSISTAIKMLLEKKKFREEDIFFSNGLYHSFAHHGDFSDIDKEKCLDKINESLVKAYENLIHADILIITFGTSYVFRHKSSNQIVGNCHKLSAAEFDRFRLGTDEIIKEWNFLIKELKKINPSLQIIFTVSPVRHLKDGAHDNQLSKSTLLLSIDKLINLNTGLHYFPSYEIVLDELRDYRFYDEDMIHPNQTAVKYIWERFSETYFREETHNLIKEWQKISLAINHRPINAQSDEYKHFLRQTLLKLKTFANKYPYICFDKEMSELENKLQVIH